MKKTFCILVLVFAAAFGAGAQDFARHEWRIGYGDMLYERAAFYQTAEKFNYHYNGHFFTEYQYNFKDWLGAGMKVDFSNVNWDSIYDENNHYFFNLCFIPEVRFTYMRVGIFSMYSGIGVGVLVNSGSEVDYRNRTTVAAPVLDLDLVSCAVQWGKGATSNWFAAVDLGGLFSFNNKIEVFMASARVFSISIGYRL